jgi:holo-[acyl-carrier-protein] synthase
MILGIGTDLVDIARMEAMHHRYGEALARRLLTQDELRDWAASTRPADFLAKRFAAEALAKCWALAAQSRAWATSGGERRWTAGIYCAGIGGLISAAG